MKSKTVLRQLSILLSWTTSWILKSYKAKTFIIYNGRHCYHDNLTFILPSNCCIYLHFLTFYEISLPLEAKLGFWKNKIKPYPFYLKICFLHAMKALLWSLEMLRLLCKLDSSAFGQLSGKGGGRKGTALGSLRAGIQQIKPSDSCPKHKGPGSNRLLYMLHQIVLFSREHFFVLVIH